MCMHMLDSDTFATHLYMLLQRFLCRKIDQIKYDARHFDAAFKTYLRKKKMKVDNLLLYSKSPQHRDQFFKAACLVSY